MPAQYDAIKRSYMDKGKDEDEAQRIAAMTFIKRGKGGSPSSRAKSLHADKKGSRRKPKAHYPMPKEDR